MPTKHKPDFIIGGAARCGTTWTYELLKKHPKIFMAGPRQPEPKFFLKDDLYKSGINWYLGNWFKDAPKEKLWGEKTTAYLEGGKKVAERIHSNLPSIKLIFILRNPVDRAYSNFLWSKMNGWETLTFDQAIAKEKQREKALDSSLQTIRPYSYASRGLYCRQLKPFYDLFPSSQILCLRFEDLVANPREFAASIHRFLGVKERPEDSRNLKPVNAAGKNAAAISLKTTQKLHQYFAKENARLGTLLGTSFKGWD